MQRAVVIVLMITGGSVGVGAGAGDAATASKLLRVSAANIEGRVTHPRRAYLAREHSWKHPENGPWRPVAWRRAVAPDGVEWSWRAMMNDRNAGEEMVSELGIDPALDIDTDQRAELLRSWHKEGSEGDDPSDEGKERSRDDPSRPG